MAIRLGNILGSWLETNGFSVEMVDDHIVEVKYGNDTIGQFGENTVTVSILKQCATDYLDDLTRRGKAPKIATV